MRPLSKSQQVALVALRTLIGWHFVYEGYYKLMLPGWSHAGEPLPAWSAASYLKAASGPLAGLFRALSESRMLTWIDTIVPVGLVLVGLSLMLGALTTFGCWGALAFLALFYLSALPTSGQPQAGAEGAYLLVSKTLVEGAAVLALLVFRTGEIAGLDRLRARRA
jgi:thiosulfate dehydrogenase [quinone] large subunit